jgi:hypothetical protein
MYFLKNQKLLFLQFFGGYLAYWPAYNSLDKNHITSHTMGDPIYIYIVRFLSESLRLSLRYATDSLRIDYSRFTDFSESLQAL